MNNLPLIRYHLVLDSVAAKAPVLFDLAASVIRKVTVYPLVSLLVPV